MKSLGLKTTAVFLFFFIAWCRPCPAGSPLCGIKLLNDPVLPGPVKAEFKVRWLKRDVRYFAEFRDPYGRLLLKTAFKYKYPPEINTRQSTFYANSVKGISLNIYAEDKNKDKREFSAALPLPEVIASYDDYRTFIWGEYKNTGIAQKLRQLGVPCGMVYRYHDGRNMCRNDVPYYREYASDHKQDMQLTEYRRNVLKKFQKNRYRLGCVSKDRLNQRPERAIHSPGKNDAAIGELWRKIESNIRASDRLSPKNDRAKEGLRQERVRMLKKIARHHDRLPEKHPGYLLWRKWSWADTQWLNLIQHDLKNVVIKNRRFHPISYSLGDEISSGFFSDPFDFDYSPVMLKGFREWLKKSYGDLARLNRQWGTRYSDWEQVVPFTTDETKILNFPVYKTRFLKLDPGKGGRGRFEIGWDEKHVPGKENFSSWSDFRTFNDMVFSHALAGLHDTVSKHDPGIPAGVLGGQAPSAFGGWDYWKIMNAVTWLEAYDIGQSKEIIRSFNTALDKPVPVVRTLFSGGNTAKWALWYYLLHGDSGTIIWNLFQGDQAYLTPEHEPTPRALDLAETFKQLGTGVGKLFVTSEPVKNTIAVYQSQRSVQAHWMLDSETDGSTWIRRFGSWEAGHSSIHLSNTAWGKLLEDCGLQYNYLPSELIASDYLLKAGYKVLIMPKTIAMGSQETQAVKRFVKNGGLVIADTMTATMDGRCRRLGSGQLDDMFGISRPDMGIREGYCAGEPESGHWHHGSPETEAISCVNSGKNAHCVSKTGKGASIYMGRSLIPYLDARRLGQKDLIKNYRQFLIDTLNRHYKKTDPGKRLSDTHPAFIEKFEHKYGACRIISFIYNPVLNQSTDGSVRPIDFPSEIKPFRIDFDTRAHVYDLLNKKYLGNISWYKARMSPEKPLILCLVPDKPGEITTWAKVEKTKENVCCVSVSGQINSVEKKVDRFLVRLDVLTPDGSIAAGLSRNIDVGKKGFHSRFYLFDNDPDGKWTLKITDVITGKEKFIPFIKSKSKI